MLLSNVYPNVQLEDLLDSLYQHCHKMKGIFLQKWNIYSKIKIKTIGQGY